MSDIDLITQAAALGWPTERLAAERLSLLLFAENDELSETSRPLFVTCMGIIDHMVKKEGLTGEVLHAQTMSLLRACLGGMTELLGDVEALGIKNHATAFINLYNLSQAQPDAFRAWLTAKVAEANVIMAELDKEDEGEETAVTA